MTSPSWPETAVTGASQAASDTGDNASDTRAFYDYVRGCSDVVPPGHTEAGLRIYRHLVYLGASQMVESRWPEMREQLGEQAWRTLIEAFVRQSNWTSNYYADLIDDFTDFLVRESA